MREGPPKPCADRRKVHVGEFTIRLNQIRQRDGEFDCITLARSHCEPFREIETRGCQYRLRVGKKTSTHLSVRYSRSKRR